MLRIHCKIALCFLISLFDLSAILKIRNGEHAHYVRLVVAYTWNREKQMFVALGKEFDMLTLPTDPDRLRPLESHSQLNYG